MAQDALSVLPMESAVKAAALKEAHTVNAGAAGHRPVAAIPNPEVPAAAPAMANPIRKETAPARV